MTTIISYDRDLPEIAGRTAYTRPGQYLEKLGDGDYAVRQGRRPSDMFLVEKLRAAVDDWRDAGYPGISDVTRRLFQFWFDEDHLLADGTVWRYWWCQREAIETLVYLVEVRGFTDFMPLAQAFGDKPKHGMLEMDFQIETTMDGQRLLRRWVPEVEKDALHELPDENLLRYAFKMATGSGKTVVMAMAIVWSYFNARLSPSPLSRSRERGEGAGGNGVRAHADNFLIVAPNIIVYERLERDFASNKTFNQLPLIPPEWRGRWSMKVILRGDSAMPDPGGNLFVVNIQQIYESREEEWTPANAVDAILGTPPKQDLAAYQPSMLERIKSLNSLMVLNDEAHHVHDDDLAWNKTLLALHENLKQKTLKVSETFRVSGVSGLTLWLDFSATPKTQAGTYYPWIIVDYPLAQAIEDRIVKAPLIVHRVDRADPDRIVADNVVEMYSDWIAVALERWREHYQTFQQVSRKPVLFIMTERTAYADRIGQYLIAEPDLRQAEVLVIHTDTEGRIYKRDLAKAREAARNIDTNRVKVIVSVLMLREGWDVNNVTVILGLRPFTSQAHILPEQAVGRGLRLMQGIGPDRRQTLEVIGTEAFEEFVRELEQEGVGIDTVSDPPPPSITIYPIQERLGYDIAIPLTRPKYTHEYRNLDELDPLSLDPIYTQEDLAEELRIDIEITFATTETTVHQAQITPGMAMLTSDFLTAITKKIAGRINLDGFFSRLYPIVKRYMQHRCFGQEVDLESKTVREYLRNPMVQDAVAAFLSRKIAELTAEEREIEFENPDFRLSETRPFAWRRQHVECGKTIFNLVATYNDLETRFAQFLHNCPDILRFASLACTGDASATRFKVDYLKANGAIGFYHPDFVAVQQTNDGEVNWIIETKGREFEDVQHKDASIRDWCEKISAQTGQTWRYLKVPQALFDTYIGESFSGLEECIVAHVPDYHETLDAPG